MSELYNAHVELRVVELQTRNYSDDDHSEERGINIYSTIRPLSQVKTVRLNGIKKHRRYIFHEQCYTVSFKCPIIVRIFEERCLFEEYQYKHIQYEGGGNKSG